MEEGMAMAADLVDLRAKITELTNQVLEAHSRAKSLDKSEIVRAVLEEWAKKEVHVATLVQRLTRVEGVDREHGGT